MDHVVPQGLHQVHIFIDGLIVLENYSLSVCKHTVVRRHAMLFHILLGVAQTVGPGAHYGYFVDVAANMLQDCIRPFE